MTNPRKPSKQERIAPGREVEEILGETIREATRQVEEELSLEDTGWVNLSRGTNVIIGDVERLENLRLSRLYYLKDPLGRQAIRLWTDYTFGPGMTWSTEDDGTRKALESFWNSPSNQTVLSARGQRKSSDKVLVDGEIFFAIFLGKKGEATIRRIDPLEITEIITDPEDFENVKFYRRKWTDRQATQHETIYRSTANMAGEECQDMAGQTVKHNDEALVYHLSQNTIGMRGNPLLLPALDWIKQYRRFLASRVAIMLALARFAWRTKVGGGQTKADVIRGKVHDQEVKAGSWLIESGADTTPISTESGARNAYQDGRMLKLQVAAAVGIPEQYFGDISIGNLATAKTVELPMMKMFQSYQKVWADAYQDIDEVVMRHAGVADDKMYVDRDFPKIAPSDVAEAAEAIVGILGVIPEFAYSPDVQQIALMTLGVNDPAEVIAQLEKLVQSNPAAALSSVLKRFRESLKNDGKGGNLPTIKDTP